MLDMGEGPSSGWGKRLVGIHVIQGLYDQVGCRLQHLRRGLGCKLLDLFFAA